MDLEKFNGLKSKVIDNYYFSSHQYFFGQGTYVFCFVKDFLDKLDVYYNTNLSCTVLSFDIRKTVPPPPEEAMLLISLELPSIVGEHLQMWDKTNLLRYKKDIGTLIDRGVVDICDLYI